MICALDTNRTSTNGHGLASREVTALSVYFFLFFAAMGCLIPFLTIFLRRRGLSFTEIGICGTIWAVVGIGSQMVLGHLSDALGSRRLFAAISCVSVGMSFFFYGFAHSFAAFALLYAWTGLGHLGTFALPQAIISDWTSAAGSAARGFSSTRVWGTIGFVAPLLVITKYPLIAKGTSFLYLAASLFLLSAIPILVIREAPVKTTRQGVVKGAMQVLASQRAGLTH
jgi:MFS family permease